MFLHCFSNQSSSEKVLYILNPKCRNDMTGLRQVFSNDDFVLFSGEFPLLTVPAFLSGYLFSGASLEVKIFFQVIILLFSELATAFFFSRKPHSIEIPFSRNFPSSYNTFRFLRMKGIPQNFKYHVIMHTRTVIRFRIYRYISLLVIYLIF